MINKIQENVNYLRNIHNLSRRQFFANMVHVPYTVIEQIEKEYKRSSNFYCSKNCRNIFILFWMTLCIKIYVV